MPGAGAGAGTSAARRCACCGEEAADGLRRLTLLDRPPSGEVAIRGARLTREVCADCADEIAELFLRAVGEA